MSSSTIGFIGLGEMGKPMVGRILEGGHAVVSCANWRREAIEALAAKGLVELANPNEVGAKSDIVISIVTDVSQTDTVLRGPQGAMAAMSAGDILILMSTHTPDYSRDLAKEADDLGIITLDCPVSGGATGAQQGTLALLAGGLEEAVEKCRAVLECMGSIIYLGDVGMGQVAKLANNAIAFGHAALIWEIRDFVKVQGMEAEAFMEVLSVSTGRSFVSENWQVINQPDVWPHMTELIAKDLEQVVAAADDVGAPMPMTRTSQALDWASTKDGFD